MILDPQIAFNAILMYGNEKLFGALDTLHDILGPVLALVGCCLLLVIGFGNLAKEPRSRNNGDASSEAE